MHFSKCEREMLATSNKKAPAQSLQTFQVAQHEDIYSCLQELYSTLMQFPTFPSLFLWCFGLFWIFWTLICSHFRGNQSVFKWLKVTSLLWILVLRNWSWAYRGISKSRAFTGQPWVMEVFIDTQKNILLVLIQTEMWNNYRDGKLAKQIMEGASWMIGQSVLTWRKGCMGSQAVSPSEKLWHSWSFQVLWSSCHCPLRRCPSWKCLASLLPSLRQWLLPKSAGFSRFHTSYCLTWSPAPLEGGSHGTFSVTKKQKNQKQLAKAF